MTWKLRGAGRYASPLAFFVAPHVITYAHGATTPSAVNSLRTCDHAARYVVGLSHRGEHLGWLAEPHIGSWLNVMTRFV